MGANATQRGKRTSRIKPDLWYFDQLPPTARQALANADYQWSSGAVLGKWKRGQSGWKTGFDISKRVQEWDKWAATKR
jgi:hypothetical protein